VGHLTALGVGSVTFNAYDNDILGTDYLLEITFFRVKSDYSCIVHAGLNIGQRHLKTLGSLEIEFCAP